MKKFLTSFLIVVDLFFLVSCEIHKIDFSLIPGSEPAHIKEAKYIASLRNPWPFCVGAIISPHYVLTAAHCLLDQKVETLQVVVGTDVYGDCRGTHGGKAYDVESIKSFGEADDTERSKDLALVRVRTSTPIVFSSTVGKIELAPKGRQLRHRDDTIFFGWAGRSFHGSSSNTLKKVNMTYMHKNSCNYYFRYKEDIGEQQICAVAKKRLNQPSRLCVGDSGGLLVSQNPQGNSMLFGIMTYPYSCMQVRSPHPDLFTDISFYSEKILKYLQKHEKNG